MKTSATVVWPVIGFLPFFILLVAQPAYAYIDPGTGSFLIQMMLAALVGIAFSIRLYWQKLKEWLRRVMGRKH